MEIKITTRHIRDRRAAKKFKSYMLSKISRIKTYLRRDGEMSTVNIILHSAKLSHTAEIIVSGAGLRATASVTSDDMTSSIDNVTDAVTKQLRRKGDKRISMRRRKVVGESAGVETQQPGIKTQRVAVKPMSTEEAVLQITSSDRDFIAFRNSETQEMNVIYEKDGKLRLIVP